jgi:predicted MFS family arabinose efflux permease
MAAATFAQQIFGVLASFLIDEFDISRSQLGLLTTAAFIVGAIGSPIAGGLVDRVGGRRVFAGSMALVCLATLVMAAAPNFLLMIAGAGIAGVALGCNNPTTNKLIARILAPGERGVIMGFKQAGVQIGVFYIGLVIPALATEFGWRVAFASTIVVPLSVLVATLRLIPPDPATVNEPDAPSTRGLHGTVWWMTGYAVLMGAGVATLIGYLPLYLHERLGYSAGAAGIVIGIIGAIGIVSRIAWGWEAERKGHFARPLVMMGIGSVAATLLIMGAEAAGSWMLWVAVVLIGATAVTWNVVGMLAIVAEVDGRAAGLASGYVQTGFYLGFVFSPVLFGYLVDRTGEYTLGWLCVAAAFAAATGIALAWYVTRARARHARATSA